MQLFLLFRGVFRTQLKIHDGAFLRKPFFFGFLLQIATHAHTTIKSKTKKLKREWKIQKNTLLL